MLQPFTVNAPPTGTLQSSSIDLARKSVAGACWAEFNNQTNRLPKLRSPLNGKVDRILVRSGSVLSQGDPVLTIKSDEQSVWEALRGLSVVGQKEDLPLIERYANGTEPVSERIKQQATSVANAIKSRSH